MEKVIFLSAALGKGKSTVELPKEKPGIWEHLNKYLHSYFIFPDNFWHLTCPTKRIARQKQEKMVAQMPHALSFF
jgi:hypothetical protein